MGYSDDIREVVLVLKERLERLDKLQDYAPDSNIPFYRGTGSLPKDEITIVFEGECLGALRTYMQAKNLKVLIPNSEKNSNGFAHFLLDYSPK
ncbi:MAG: hypothetical protein QM613_04810 [Micrococcaceae bacterium]